MKYYHNYIYKSKNWIETIETDPMKVIRDFYYKKCFVHDADQCGNDTVEFAFDINGTTVYYRLTYSWYIDYDPEWNIYNEHEIVKINEPTYDFPGNRDWLDV